MELNIKKVNREFYERDTLEVAKELLGKYILHNKNDMILVSKIIETEAYKENDRAAHFFNGKRTKRTDVVFGKGGVVYVYLIYGMYYCFNIVTEKTGVPGAVLIRKLEPLIGIEKMMENRKITDVKKLSDGPGKLCISMDITKQVNGIDLTGDILYVAEDVEKKDVLDIKYGKRINIDYADEDKELLWRFYYGL